MKNQTGVRHSIQAAPAQRNKLKKPLTDAQTATLGKMPLYRMLDQLDNGAVVIVFERLESTWMVVDIDGRVHGFEHYLSVFPRHS